MKNSLILIMLFLFLISCKDDISSELYNNSSIKEKTGIIIGDVVNVRSEATIKGEILTNLKRGERIKILSVTDKKATVGKFTDKWLHVKTSEGITGYVFGAFLFELDELFRGYHWNYITYSEWGFGLKFNRDYSGTFVYADKKSSKITISYTINGIKLILNMVSTEFLPPVLHFYRYKGKNYLTKKAHSLEHNFENEAIMTTDLISNTYQSMEKFLLNTPAIN